MVNRLSSSQEELLRSLVEEHGAGALTSERCCSSDLRELADGGYLSDFHAYIDGTCAFSISGRAEAYFEELEREVANRKRAARHDWALNLVNGVYLIAGAVLGVVAGVVATLVASGWQS